VIQVPLTCSKASTELTNLCLRQRQQLWLLAQQPHNLALLQSQHLQCTTHHQHAATNRLVSHSTNSLVAEAMCGSVLKARCGLWMQKRHSFRGLLGNTSNLQNCPLLCSAHWDSLLSKALMYKHIMMITSTDLYELLKFIVQLSLGHKQQLVAKHCCLPASSMQPGLLYLQHFSSISQPCIHSCLWLMQEVGQL